MKIRSKPLYQFLLDADVLHGTKEAIVQAKRNYRTQYKRAWKRQSRPRKEIRFEVTLKQYGIIKARARKYNQRPITYARNVIIAEEEGTHLIADRDTLLRVLQLVSMATNALSTNSILSVSKLLETAETTLLEYIHNNP
ncbi:hypothetical protein KXQ82_01960 [Mucilaginibacter sp. HMF5004]|uniref:hypothetical protein n=1 Tax=Mucilaginibacter rivuli TaxID=2857527 RepID=UPI001C5E02D3|nr:hypothetical protein [Mucilaginibacter rivuli]MBW4888455.1 hypothetical protein [Mucilaginibacter rivuli]